MEEKVFENRLDIREAYVSFLEDKLRLHGKTLIHYPDAVEKYVPRYIQRHINSSFMSFYGLCIESTKKIYEQLQNSNEWEGEITRKTWKLRLKATEHFISFIEEENKK